MRQQENSQPVAPVRKTIAHADLPGKDPDQLRQALAERSSEISRLQQQLHSARRELLQAYKTRDTLGSMLQNLFQSRIWKWGRPAWLLARLKGRLQVGIDRLMPLLAAERTANGGWEGKGPAQFFVPLFPARGWVRIRAKIRSSVASRAVLYFDSGFGFRQVEHFELGPVIGQTVIDQIALLPTTTYAVRFDPIQHGGEFTLEEFSLEPIASSGVNLRAIYENVRKALGKSGRRPSIKLGIKLLLHGQWQIFHRQLLTNVWGGTVWGGAGVHEYDLWRNQNRLTERLRQQMRQEMAGWREPPTISVILPVYNVAEDYLRRCIDSVIGQLYPHWELCIADDASTEPHVKRVLAEYAGDDPRIKVVYREKNGNISAASNSALELATGSYTALLDHDDEIAEHALFRMAEAIVADPSLDMLYSDEDKLTAEGKHVDPFFKPDWSPEYFLACMYTCHMGVYRTERLRQIGGWRSEFDSAQDYDLVLRFVAGNPKIAHVPDVLYHWRAITTSTASGAQAKPEAHRRARRALQAYLDASGREGHVEAGPSEGFHRIRYAINGNPKVSIIIPSACRPVQFRGRKSWFVLECVRSVRRLSTYRNLEIIVLDNNDMSDELTDALKPFDVRRIPFLEPFNLARKMNVGAMAAQGQQLLFLNDDIEVITPDWIESMLEFSQWPEIGVVGVQLLFPNNTQQHTGVTVLNGNPGHPFYQFPATHPGYFFSSQVHRNWSAVTGACMMTRADVFHSVAGFSEDFPLNYNDVDYCLKVRNTGRRIVYMPYARLYHHESVTKSGTYAHELDAFKKVWLERLGRDPYYNPNLTTQNCDFRIG